MKTRLERLIAIEDKISNNYYPNIDTLCELFAVKPRTVYEDVKLLRNQVGLDIRYDRFRKGYYNASPRKRIPSWDISDDQFLLLIMAARVLISYFGDGAEANIHDALSKIHMRLPRNSKIALESANSLVHGSPSQPKVSQAVALTLANACLVRKFVCLSMRDAAGPLHGKTFDPICFLSDGASLAFLCLAEGCSQPVKIALRDVASCELTDKLSQRSRLEIESLLGVFSQDGCQPID